MSVSRRKWARRLAGGAFAAALVVGATGPGAVMAQTITLTRPAPVTATGNSNSCNAVIALAEPSCQSTNQSSDAFAAKQADQDATVTTTARSRQSISPDLDATLKNRTSASQDLDQTLKPRQEG